MKYFYRVILATSLLVLAFVGVSYYLLFTPFATHSSDPVIYVDRNDTKDSVLNKIVEINPQKHLGVTLGYKLLDIPPRMGKYRIKNTLTGFDILRMFRNGQQEPVNLVITPTWTIEIMASRISSQLMIDSAEIMTCLQDTTTLTDLNCTIETLPAYFIPNTYEVYWNISPQQLVQRMKREYDKFWTPKRREKASLIGLSQYEVSTLASIVCRETNFVPEMSTIAGLYLNRRKRNMLLQACPTVIFARKDFSTRRLTNPTEPDNPYNTYRYLGFPPGPIFLAPIVAIDAVLNAEKHNYIYMCAKEDFSGAHNFATTLIQHQQNARKYRTAFKKRYE